MTNDPTAPGASLTNPKYLDELLEDVKRRVGPQNAGLLVTLSDVQDGIAELARERDAFRDLTTYDHRSEFSRLKKADVDQGRRIAELLAQVEYYKTACNDLTREAENAGECYAAQQEVIKDLLADNATLQTATRHDAALIARLHDRVTDAQSRVAELEDLNRHMVELRKRDVALIGRLELQAGVIEGCGCAGCNCNR